MKISFTVILILLLFINFIYSDSNNDVFNHRKIGIIGGGAGGSSCSYFIRKELGDEVDITLFEKDNRIGGRTENMIYEGFRIETGGSIYHEKNKLVADFVEMLNFDAYNPTDGIVSPEGKFFEDDGNTLLGIWNGKEAVFQEHPNKYMFYLQFFWRYGYSPISVDGIASDALNKFISIYDLFDNGQSFDSVKELVEAMGLFDYTQQTLEDLLIKERNQNADFVHEFVTGLTRVNYGQDTTLNALVGLIALIGSTDYCRTVSSGNSNLLAEIINHSNTQLKLNSKVTDIIYNENKKYTLKFNDENNGEKTEEFDTIIIATPIEFSDIKFSTNIPFDWFYKRPYQRTYVTFVTANLKPGFFGFTSDDQNFPQVWLTTEDSSQIFTSISLKRKLDNGKSIYKLFSREFLESETIDKLFDNRSNTFQTDYFAYPMLEPVSYNYMHLQSLINQFIAF
eukprot:TRINITY_DN3699_c0_g1_i1.p1 TRINITY_DN3699_c0_g1~~TRINITY_DN3699_c0_g1_i1.p1  ORF type:complete len:452 (+),score=133.68 TRINITY_DN3699_c0_g1_i1:18-1373(+)